MKQFFKRLFCQYCKKELNKFWIRCPYCGGPLKLENK